MEVGISSGEKEEDATKLLWLSLVFGCWKIKSALSVVPIELLDMP
jgi:hypothetical protein